MTITPEQADRLKKNATDGPWMLNPQGCILVDDGTDAPPGPHGFIGTMWKNGHPDEEANGLLMAAAPDLAQTIAGMRWEYGVERATGAPQWFGSRPMAEAHAEVRGGFRLVRRLVGPTEAIDSE